MQNKFQNAEIESAFISAYIARSEYLYSLEKGRKYSFKNIGRSSSDYITKLEQFITLFFGVDYKVLMETEEGKQKLIHVHNLVSG